MTEKVEIQSSLSKKPRVESESDVYSDRFFAKHYADTELILGLRYCLSALQEWNEYSVCLLKILNCNGTEPCSFLKAFCQTERHECEHSIVNNSTIVKKISFASLFKYGEELVAHFIKPRNETRLPQKKGARIALAKLLEFITRELIVVESCLTRQLERGVTDSEWTAMVAHHLLTRLAVCPFYVIDHQHPSRYFQCPCPCGQRLCGTYGDTTIGSPFIWHGSVDIMMDTSITISKERPEPPGCHGNRSYDEEKETGLKSSREQMLAQSIVNSFLQKKLHPNYTNHLIPSIGIARDRIVVYFYDCDNDILLESAEMPFITAQGGLVKPTFMALWLVLNFKYFCSGITTGMLEPRFQSGFLDLVNGMLGQYLQVTSPCVCPSVEPELPWTWGSPPENDEPAEKLENFNGLGPWV